MILACQVILGMSRRECTFLLNMVQYILHLTLIRSGQSLPLHDQKLLVDIPKDFQSVDTCFPLDSKHTIYAVCPNIDCLLSTNPSIQMHPWFRYMKTIVHISNSPMGRHVEPVCFGLTVWAARQSTFQLNHSLPIQWVKKLSQCLVTFQRLMHTSTITWSNLLKILGIIVSKIL